MYTQCSQCETVFELSADVLRTAGGQVRCGNCGEVFNALTRLAEDASAFVADETPIDLETRADNILESSAAQQAAAQQPEGTNEWSEDERPGVEIASLQVMDWPPEEPEESLGKPPEEPPVEEPPVEEPPVEEPPPIDDQRSLEFTLPPGELDRIFIESKNPMRLDVTALGASPPENAAADPAPAARRVTGFEIPEDVRRDMLAGVKRRIASPPIATGARATPRRTFLLWASAAAVSALLLMMQILHQNLASIAAPAQGPVGSAVRALYGAVGSALPEPANLSAYQLRQWGATVDPKANGILRLRASILNATTQPQPWPVLRVTLADRFGKSIGRRDFQPGEYMDKPTAAMLAPGERTDATLDILDPGKNAEGFEIDVCVHGAKQRVSCANDVAPQVER